MLALQLIVSAARPITQAAGVQVLFSSLTGDILLDALIGAVFAIISYSSLAAVLITATLTAAGVISFKVALCLVIGANLGSGLLAMLNASGSNAAGKRVALGSLLFKLLGSLAVLPFINLLAPWLDKMPVNDEELVIFFHVFYNLIRCPIMVPFADPMARLCTRLISDDAEADMAMKPRHLDRSALDTPTLALVNAARETLRIGDVLEMMLEAFNKVVHGEVREERTVRRLDDDVDVLYTAIKLYLARMPKEDLSEEDSRRWGEIIEMSLNLEQAGDIIERMSGDVADKALNLRLSLSVFLSRDVTSAKRLRRAKHRFRILIRRFSHAHVERLHQKNVQSIETSSLHLGLLGDMKRLNSLLCSVAYTLLEQPDDERDEE